MAGCRFRWVAIRVWFMRMYQGSVAAVYFAFNWLIYKLDYARSYRYSTSALDTVGLLIHPTSYDRAWCKYLAWWTSVMSQAMVRGNVCCRATSQYC